MTRQIKRASIVAGLAVVATLVTSGREARADLAGGLSPDALAGGSPGPSITESISVKGGIVQNGDPSYTYQLEVFFTGTILSGDTVSLNNLVAVNRHSSTSILKLDPAFTPTDWSTVHGITLSTPNGHVHEGHHTYPVSDVTWTYSGPTEMSAVSVLLGVFEVTTAHRFNHSLPAQYPSFLTDQNGGVSYSYSLNGGNPLNGGISGTGEPITLNQGGVFVPEPSTAIAPLSVMAALPVVWLIKRRRARSLQAA